MEIIIVLAVIALIAVVWVRDKADKSKDPVDTWEPPKEMHLADKPWPYGEKLPEGKIHVNTTDVSGSQNRVEATAPVSVPVNIPESAATVPVPLVPESAPVKKAAAKKPVAEKTAAKPAVAKKTPAKKKSV